MKIYPIKFKPVFKKRVWGGSVLAGKYTKPFPLDIKIGESWEISDRQDSMSMVENGEYKDMPLSELVHRFGKDFLGNINVDRFPILLKVIDARDVLSVQVHPADEYANRNEGGSDGKTEMWYVMEADKGAKITAGLKGGINRERFISAMKDNKIAQTLNTFSVSAGDVIFIPSGRIHAIGEGIVLLEIQQNTDITYRIYDWDRAGFDGKPRELHIKKALDVINFEDSEKPVIAGNYETKGNNKKRDMVKCGYFSNSVYYVKDKIEMRTSDSFNIVSCVEGEVEIYAGGVVERISKAYSCVIPASAGIYFLKNIRPVESAVVVTGKGDASI